MMKCIKRIFQNWFCVFQSFKVIRFSSLMISSSFLDSALRGIIEVLLCSRSTYHKLVKPPNLID